MRMTQKDRYEIGPDAQALILDTLRTRCDAKSSTFANAREVRNLFERIIMMQANRIATATQISETELVSVIRRDIELAIASSANELRPEAEAVLVSN